MFHQRVNEYEKPKNKKTINSITANTITDRTTEQRNYNIITNISVPFLHQPSSSLGALAHTLCNLLLLRSVVLAAGLILSQVVLHYVGELFLTVLSFLHVGRSRSLPSSRRIWSVNWHMYHPFSECARMFALCLEQASIL